MHSTRLSSIKLKNTYQVALDNVLWNHYLVILREEPKDPSMSKSLYLTCLAIRVLEKMGNTYPSQDEIDAVEAIMKRFQARKLIKALSQEVVLNTSREKVLYAAA